MTITAEDFAAFAKGNVEAFTASGQILTAGVQDLTSRFADTARQSVEDSVAVFKTFGSVKSVQDLFAMQVAYSKTAAAKAVELVTASAQLTEQVMAPLTARANVAMTAFGKAA